MGYFRRILRKLLPVADRPYCTFRHRGQRETTPPRRVNPTRTFSPIRPRPQQAPADLGPRFATLLVELHAIWVQLAPLKQRSQELEGLAQSAQAIIDLNSIDLDALDADKRLDYSIEIEILQIALDESTEALAGHRDELDNISARLNTLTTNYDKLWKQLCPLTQQYCNLSFDVDFDKPWCLDINGYDLLAQCAKYHEFLKKRQSEVIELRTKQILLPRNQQLHRRTLGDQLDDSHLADFAREVDATDIRLKELSSSLAHGQRSLASYQDEFLLEYAGPLAEEWPEVVDIDDSDGPASPIEVSDGSEEGVRTLNSPANLGAQSSPRSDFSLPDDPEALQDLYVQVRDSLAEAQANYTRRRVTFMSQQAQHLLVFTNSNPARYEYYVKQSLELTSAEVEKQEETFVRVRQRLLDLSIPFPSEPVTAQVPPTGGGIRLGPRDTRPGFDAGKAYEVASALNIDRRKLIEWRAQPVQHSATLTAGTTPRSVDLTGLAGTSPVRARTPSAPPDSERKRKLDQWKKDNGERDDEAEEAAPPRKIARRRRGTAVQY